MMMTGAAAAPNSLGFRRANAARRSASQSGVSLLPQNPKAHSNLKPKADWNWRP